MTQSRKSPHDRIAADEGLSAFGAEVRELRKARQLTLAALAKNSGVSISHLSAIERGTVNPTLSKITQIADALGVPEEWFFALRKGAGPMERNFVVRGDNRRNLNLLYDEPVEQSGYSDQLLSSSIGGGFHMGLSEYPPYSEDVTVELYSRDGEQHGFVLEGELILTLSNEEIVVRKGDSFSFPAQILHGLRNASAEKAQLIWVNSPVIIPKTAVLEANETNEALPETPHKKRVKS